MIDASRQKSADVDPQSAARRVASLVAARPVVDGHNDLVWEARDRAGYDWDAFDIGVRRDEVHTDLPRLREGGVGAQFWSVYVPGTLAPGEAVIATLEQIDGVHTMAARYPADVMLATTAADVAQARSGGRLAALIGAEGGQSIGRSLGALRMLRALGMRYLTLTHNHHVGWADSATDLRPGCGGLTAFGRAVVAEMNRIGVIVDLSHVSAATMHAALEVSVAPVIFSHSSAAAVTDCPRNVPDDVLATMASAGGVCMVTFVPDFVSPAAAVWRAQEQARCREAGLDANDWETFTTWSATHSPPKPEATVADVVRHVEHVREVAGIEHVGLGGDYDGTLELPIGLHDVSCYPALLTALAERGWSDADLTALVGGNVLRVLREVDEIAAAESARRGPDLSTYDALDGRAT